MRLLALFFIVASSACVSFFPPHALDIGRGAEPLKVGTLQAHGGVGGGTAPFALAVGLGGGAGLEGQLTDDFAVGLDVGGGVQGSPIGAVAPAAGYVTFQYNPAGFDSLALRGAVGGGGDYVAFITPGENKAGLAPWAAASGGVVTSTKFGAIDGYLALNVGARRFIGGQDNIIIQETKGSGLTNSIYAAGATAGVNVPVSDALGVYVSGNITGLMFVSDESAAAANTASLLPLFQPTADAQIGITYSFDAPR